MRRFESTEGGSSKFWQIEQTGSSFTAIWGRIGTDGQRQTKSFSSPAAAAKEHDKLVAEKLKKGYVEKTAKAAKPAKASKPAAPKAAGALALISTGRQLVYEMADDDVCDRYRFTIDRSNAELAVTFEGASGKGSWTFTEGALASSRSWLQLAQGGAIGSDDKSVPKAVKRDLPPFLVSRAVLAELRKGTSTLRPEWARAEEEVEVVAKGKAALLLDGKETKVDVLKVAGRRSSFWVVDDERWPLVLWRDEDGNYWHLRGRGAAVPLESRDKGDTEKKLIVEQARFAVKHEVPGDEAGLIQELSGKGSLKARCRAAALAGKKRSPETLAALFLAIGGEYDLKRAVVDALGQRMGDPEFGPLLRATLDAEAKQVRTRRPAGDTKQDLHDARTISLLEFIGNSDAKRCLSHEPLAELVRALARKAPNDDVRSWSRYALTQAKDAVYCQEVIDRIDKGDAFEDLDAAKSAVEAVLCVLPLDQARLEARKLIAAQPKKRAEEAADKLWEAFLGPLDRDDPAQVRQLIGWLGGSKGAEREAYGDELAQAECWGKLYDLKTPQGIDGLIKLDLQAESEGVSRAIEEQLATVKDPQLLPKVLSLLQRERRWLVRQQRPATLVIELLDKVPAKTLAPLVGAVIPKAKLDDDSQWNSSWVNLVESLVARKNPEWKPVLQAIAKVLEAKKDPDMFGDALQSIRERLG